jgi:putative ABC transport system permease protein
MPDVVGLILGEGMRVTGLAIVLGGAAGLALSRFIGPLLFQTAANDLRVYAAVAAMLVLVALGSSAVPAWRAARVDPNVALREE